MQLCQAGIPTWATARRPDALRDLADASCRTLTLDVSNDDQAKAAIAAVEAEHGAVGYLINDAATSSWGPLKSSRSTRFEPSSTSTSSGWCG